MCGISGYVVCGASAQCQNIIYMNAALRHRGPDDEGFCILENGTLNAYAGVCSSSEIKQSLPIINQELHSKLAMGFSRLAILDLSAQGHQPMLSKDGQVAVTFNGQIYNYKKLRSELQNLGHTFKSQSDTEVLLQSYMQWGIEMLPKLNGMFAIAITDLREQKILLIRDRLGLKPVFYQHTADRISWASELKAILTTEWGAADLDMEGLLQNFHLRTCTAPKTCFQGIEALEAAHWMEIDMKTLQTKKKRYWQIPKPNGQSRDKQAALEELEHLLKDAVSLRLQADVPVISLMSGGIDSTLITALAFEQNPDIRCYTLEMAGQPDSELPHAKAMAELLGIKQIVHSIDFKELMASLQADTEHVEQPYVGPEVVMNATQHLSELGYKVLLSGNGADELFGGYASGVKFKQWLKRKRWLVPISKTIPSGIFPEKYKSTLSINSAAAYYANAQSGMRSYELEELILVKDKAALTTTLQQVNSTGNLYQDFFEEEINKGISDHHAFRDDLSAMRNGVELRFPFLDHRIVELIARLPYEWRYTGYENKPLLRRIAKKYILPQNLKLPKQGFALPQMVLWQTEAILRTLVKEKIDLLKKRNIFNSETITKWQGEALEPRTLYRLWQLFTTEIFLSTYFDN